MPPQTAAALQSPQAKKQVRLLPYVTPAVLNAFVHGLGGFKCGQARLYRLSQRLASLDAHLVAYYTAPPGRFGRSLLLHFLAFVCDGIPTYILLCLLPGESAPGFIKVIVVAVAALEQMFFFVPGRLGTMEGIRFTVLSGLGIADVYGLAFGLVARLHHLFWTGLRLLAYAVCMRWPGLSLAPRSVAPPSAAIPP